jgi:chemotaxis signal transduction protein
VKRTRTTPVGSDKLLAFEVSNCLYALPIEIVLEVAEADRATCVPGIRSDVAGVMNWNGDPLPLVASDLVLCGGDPPAREGPVGSVLRDQILVLSDRGDETPRIGLPVDRVQGLITGRTAAARTSTLIVERCEVGGRIVAILDPRLLVERAGEIIERAVA